MKKEEYLKIGKKLGLPPRCPILQYCGRRATTIYVFTGLEDHLRGRNPIKALQDEGIVPNDFEEKQIEPQGEAFEYSKSKFSTVYLNCCPEVNLFDDRNGIRDALGTASISGEYDSLRLGNNKFTNDGFRHYSECAEFSKHMFEAKVTTIKPKPSKSRTTRVGISQKLRFEIFHRDKFSCQYCGRSKETDKVRLELDHIVPVSRGGTDEFSNLTTSCRDCNQGKSNKII